MADTVLSMSLDGLISGPEDDKSRPFGHRGEPLHDWRHRDGPDVAAHRLSEGPQPDVFDELMATGAVITGRFTGEFVDYWRRPPRRRTDLRPDPPGAGRQPTRPRPLRH